MKRTVVAATAVCLAACAAADDVCLELVSQVGGLNYAVDVSGERAYVGNGMGFLVLDVSNPAEPTLLGKTLLPGEIWDVAVAGEFAFAACADAGLQILDVSDPTRPVVAAVLPVDWTGVYAVRVSGGYAYLLANDIRFVVVDVANPREPRIVGELLAPYNSYGSTPLDVAGRYAVVVDASSRGLHVIDVSDPQSPLLVGRAEARGATDVVMSGGHAFVASVTGLRVFDLADPANPHLVGHYEAISAAGLAAVAISGSHAYLTRGTAGLEVIDISDPADPTLVGTHALPQIAFTLKVSETHAYVADAFGGLLVFDVSSPAAPARVGAYQTTHWLNAIDVRNATGYLADYGLGLLVMDLSDPRRPEIVGRAPTRRDHDQVAAADELAYVVGRFGLEVFDVSDPAAPVRVGEYADSRAYRNLALHDEFIYVGSSAGLRTFDVSDPAAPLHTHTYLGGQINAVVNDGEQLLCASYNGLDILDLTEPALPRKIGGLHPPSQIIGLDVVGDFAFAVGSGRRMYVVNISDPENPVLIATLDNLPASPGAISVAGRFAYLGLGYYGLLVVDISDPANPTMCGKYRTPGWGVDLAAQGRLIYFTSAAYGLWIFSRGPLGDLDEDNDVDLADLGLLLADFGCSGGECIGDVNADGETALLDLQILLDNFGRTCR
jgi:hypothetical protein